MVVAGVAVYLATRSPNDAADATPLDTVPETAAAQTVPTAPPIGTVVIGFSDWGSDYIGSKLTTLFERTTEAGIDLRLQSLSSGAGPMNPGFPMEEAPFEAVPAVAPAVSVGDVFPLPPRPDVGVDSLPTWCAPSDSYRLAAQYQGAISTMSGSLFAEAFKDLRVVLHGGGAADGKPFRVVVIQTAKDATSATVRFSDGATDTADVRNGLVVLATPGASNGKFTITVQRPAGPMVVGWAQISAEGSREWALSCAPPPPSLPSPGTEQPADVDAAKGLVASQFEGLFSPDKSFADKASYLDDTTGVENALNAVLSGGFADAAQTAIYQLDGVVFTSATEAWFRYDILANNTVFSHRFGTAHLIDGTWKISRATLCQDLALAGGACEPAPLPLVPQSASVVVGDDR